MNGKKAKKMRKTKRKSAIDLRSGKFFALKYVQEVQAAAEPPLSPEEQELTKLYKTFATVVWRMRNVIMDTETNEPKEELQERSVAKLARYLESIDGALEDARIQIRGDYVGKPYDEGDAVKVITFEDRSDLTCDEYVEVLTPTVRWTDKEGRSRLLQQAEVVVGKANS